MGQESGKPIGRLRAWLVNRLLRGTDYVVVRRDFASPPPAQDDEPAVEWPDDEDGNLPWSAEAKKRKEQG